MSPQDQDKSDDYLWTGDGPNEDVKELEALLAPMRNQRAAPRRSRTWLRALAIGGLVAFAFFGMFAAGHAPARFIALFHDGPVTELSRFGGTRVVLSVEDGNASKERTAEIGDAMRVRGASSVFVGDSQLGLDLPRLNVASARAWAEQIVAVGDFTIHKVLEDTELMRRAYRLAAEDPQPGVVGDLDSWTHSESGRSYRDFFLTGESQELIQAALNRWQQQGELKIPAGTHIAFEWVETTDFQDRYASQGYWRSYYLDSTIELGRQDIAFASVFWNPTSNTPEVLIDFSEEGGQKFGVVTGEIVGRKLAMAIDGEILMAPTVQAAIRGGSSSVSLGHSSAKEMAAEAQAFASVILSPRLTADVQITSIEAVSVSVQPWAELAARILMAFVVGVFAFILVFILGYVSRQSMSYIAPLRGNKRRLAPVIKPLFVTIFAMIAAIVLNNIGVPGGEALFENATDEFLASPPKVSWANVGILPFILGCVLAELIGWIIPGWRKRRGGDRAARMPIYNVGLLLGLLLLAFHAHVLASSLAHLGESFAGIEYIQPEFAEFDYRTVLFALLAGSSVLYGLAKLVNRFGIGNGFAVILVAMSLESVPLFIEELSLSSMQSASGFFQAFAYLTAVVLFTVFVMRRSIRLGTSLNISLPAAGIVPVVIIPTVLALWITVASFRDADLASWVVYNDHPGLEVIAVLFVSLLLTLFSLRRPQADSESRVVAGLSQSLRIRRIVVVFAVSLLFPLFILLSRYIGGLHTVLFLSAGSLVLGVAAALDWFGEFRARWRNPELVQVYDLQRPRYLSPVLESLQHAGIDVFVRGRCLRIMLSLLGPFIPMTIMVPAHRAEEAHGLIRGQL